MQFQIVANGELVADDAAVQVDRLDADAKGNADQVAQPSWRSEFRQARQIAQAYAVRGDKDNAFLWLDRGIRYGDGGMIGIKVDPLLRTLRDDPRFDALLVRLNFPNAPAYLARVTAPLRQVVVASQAR